MQEDPRQASHQGRGEDKVQDENQDGDDDEDHENVNIISELIKAPQLLRCHSAELLEALEKTTSMTEEQLKQV